MSFKSLVSFLAVVAVFGVANAKTTIPAEEKEIMD